MTKQPSKTFSLGGPYEWLGKLYSDIEDFSSAPRHNSSLRAYRAINCFLTLHHMIDWFWVALANDKLGFKKWRTENFSDLDSFKQHLYAASPAMRAAHQIATASKHAQRVKHNEHVSTEILYEALNDRVRVARDIVVRVDGVINSVEMLLDEGRGFWRAFLHENMPAPVFFPGDDPKLFAELNTLMKKRAAANTR
jgi:hypothetical protein